MNGTAGQGKGGAIFVNTGAFLSYDGISFSGNSAGNAAGTFTDNNSVYGALIIPVSPSVSSITPTGPDPTGATEVEFIARFSENVKGVNTADFSLVHSGTATGSISTCAAVNGLTYVITVTGVSGDGTLRLDFVSNGSVLSLTDDLVYPPYFVGEVIEIDTPPEAVSIAVAGSTATTVDYTVTFDEDVTGVDAGDFVVTTTHGAAASVTDVVQVSGSVYTVTVGGYPDNCTVRLDLVDNDSIKDVHGNPLGGAGSGNGDFEGDVHIVGSPPPYVLSSVPATPGPTNASTVVFTVTFSEAVSAATVDSADFMLVKTGAVACDPIGVPGTVGAVVTVTITGITGDGTLRLDVVDNGTIYDNATGTKQLGGVGLGNGNFSAGEVCIIDNTPPYVVLVTSDGPDPDLVKSAVFTVTFSEVVKNVNAADFSLLGTTSGAIFSVGSADGIVYRVVMESVQYSGVLGLEVLVSDITDLATNPLAAPYTSSEGYDPPPYVLSIAESDPSTATDVTFTVTFTEEVTGVANDLNFAVATTNGVTCDATFGITAVAADEYEVLVSNVVPGPGSLRLDLVDGDRIRDYAGNPLGGAGAGNGDASSLPHWVGASEQARVQMITRIQESPTNRPVLTFLVTFSAAITGGLDVTDFVLTKTGTADGRIASVVNLSPGIYMVTVDRVSGEGTLRLDLEDNNSITPALGGAGADNGDFTIGEVYDVDMTPPVVSSVAAAGAPAGEGYAIFTVTFSEDVTGVDVTDFVSTSGFAPVGAVSSVAQVSASVYRVTVTGLAATATVRLDVVDDDSIIDTATNPLGGGLLGNGDFTSGEVQSVSTELLGEDWWGGCVPGTSSPASPWALACLLAAAWLCLRLRRRSRMSCAVVSRQGVR